MSEDEVEKILSKWASELGGKVYDLTEFLSELKNYRTFRYKAKNRNITKKEINEMISLREKLLGKASAFRSLITELTGKEKVTVTKDGQQYSYDIWFTGLGLQFDSHTLGAIGRCIDVTIAAIGKLESDIKAGIRDGQGNLTDKSQVVRTEPPKAFISHGKKSAALNKLEEFLETLGVKPLIVKKQPSLDKDLPDKVNLYLSQADFVIILATADDKVEDKLQPRQNVIHEIGLAQKTHPGKIIYLLEEGAEFPSNIRPKVWESFKQRNMMNAFLGIVRELRAHSMLKLIKPQEQEQNT